MNFSFCELTLCEYLTQFADMSGDSNYAVVLNFYEKIDPPEKFPTFVDGWRNLGKYVQTLDHFIATQLHRNVDPNGELCCL